jgi:hypothetical protein
MDNWGTSSKQISYKICKWRGDIGVGMLLRANISIVLNSEYNT